MSNVYVYNAFGGFTKSEVTVYACNKRGRVPMLTESPAKAFAALPELRKFDSNEYTIKRIENYIANALAIEA